MADMEDKAKKDDKSCCSSGRACCGAKTLMVLVIFLLGGIIGYLMGMHCSYGGQGWHHKGYGCPMAMMGTPGQAPSSK